jgi:hypothetical protein
MTLIPAIPNESVSNRGRCAKRQGSVTPSAHVEGLLLRSSLKSWHALFGTSQPVKSETHFLFKEASLSNTRISATRRVGVKATLLHKKSDHRDERFLLEYWRMNFTMK